MAETIFRNLASHGGLDTDVLSAGVAATGSAMDPRARRAVAAGGGDMASHRGRPLTSRLLEDVDLVACMEREHVREIVVKSLAPFNKTFTLKEIVRRGEMVGHRLQEESLGDWLKRVGRGRTRDDLLSASWTDDIEDPIGLSNSAMDRTAEEIRDLCRRLVELIAPRPPSPNGDDQFGH